MLDLRTCVLALFLALAGALVAAGVQMVSPAAARIVAGVLLGLWAWLMLGEVK